MHKPKVGQQSRNDAFLILIMDLDYVGRKLQERFRGNIIKINIRFFDLQINIFVLLIGFTE